MGSEIVTQITQAQPPIEFSPPNFQPWILRLVRWVLPYWLKRRLKIDRVYTSNVEQLVELLRRFQNGNTRLILAFRHPSRDDIFCLSHLLTQALPETSVRHRIALYQPLFAHFLYDRDLPSWAGKPIGWLLERLGGVPIDRGRVDPNALEVVRNLLLDGKMPIAIAPEGIGNGYSEIVNPLEPGTAQLGFWCAADLAAVGRTADVTILPIGIQYYYLKEPWLSLEATLAQIEQETGIQADRPESIDAIRQGEPKQMKKVLYNRIYKLSQYFLYQMENFYAQFHQYQIPPRPDISESLSRQEIANRLQAVLEFSIHICETHFNINPRGSIADRCRRIERAGWDWIHPNELKTPHNLAPTSKKIADRIAVEADLRIWHMRLAESLVSVTGTYIKDRPTIDRFAETTLRIWDLLARIEGKNPQERPFLGDRIAEITVGNPISVTDRLDRYLSSRRQAKVELANLTDDIQVALNHLIH
jgi:1-acyl-sn-glycerol-3-phosphate acyltransferase